MIKNAYGNSVGCHTFISPQDVSDIEKLLFDENGVLIPVSSEIVKDIPHSQLQFFCLKHGIYSIPTIEVIELLKDLVGNPKEAIEICSGNGVYGRSLDIRSTDNFMQAEKNRAKFRNCLKAFEEAGQNPVQYGDNVHEIDAVEAVRKYKPKVIVGSWATHKYNRCESWRSGNMFGVNFPWILKRKTTERLILIGNRSIHQHNPIMEIAHREIDTPEIIFSRATDTENNCIYIWDC